MVPVGKRAVVVPRLVCASGYAGGECEIEEWDGEGWDLIGEYARADSVDGVVAVTTVRRRLAGAGGGWEVEVEVIGTEEGAVRTAWVGESSSWAGWDPT